MTGFAGKLAGLILDYIYLKDSSWILSEKIFTNGEPIIPKDPNTWILCIDNTTMSYTKEMTKCSQVITHLVTHLAEYRTLNIT